jgi:hypothetical protein
VNAIPLTAVRRAGNVVREAKDVDPALRRTAELVAELVSRRLGIARPRIRWLPADRKDIRGETLPADLSEVWVKVQDGSAVIETTAHECRHVWQLEDRQYRWLARGLETDLEREIDAAEYGRQTRRELTGG